MFDYDLYKSRCKELVVLFKGGGGGSALIFVRTQF